MRATPRRSSAGFCAAIEPVFLHVAGRHGLQINGVRAAGALPEIGEDWRQVLQTKLAAADEDTAPAQVPQVPPKEVSSKLGRKETVEGQASGCTRRGKTTGGRCRRPAAEWSACDDLPPPVAACFGHLTPEEQKACQQARDRAREECNARWQAERAALQARGVDLEPSPSRHGRASASASRWTRWGKRLRWGLDVVCELRQLGVRELRESAGGQCPGVLRRLLGA